MPTRCAPAARGGTLVHLKSRDLHELGELPVAVSPEQEQAALDNGPRLLVKDIELRLLDNDGTASAILEAHRFAGDGCPSLRQHLLGGIPHRPQLRQAIRRHRRPLLRPVPRLRQQLSAGAGTGCTRRLLPAVTAYLRRSSFPGAGPAAGSGHLPCRRADPSQFLELDKTHLKGLLLRSGGTTSHTVILARSFNIPTRWAWI
ncbi:hypothetical protein LN650_20900 [Klebsiella pneumoniae subsp. pneumoniae]|nr:hypothetical protein [Klebsiella pneumoniae subsp. pneumoniae]